MIVTRAIWPAMRNGFAKRCPACGTGPMFRAFLKVADTCPSCGEAFHHHRADDAPPYFTILIVGHVVVGAALALERWQEPSTAVHLALWVPLTLLLSVWLLPRIKGALIALQWAVRMHGFSKSTSSVRDPALPEIWPGPSEGRQGV